MGLVTLAGLGLSLPARADVSALDIYGDELRFDVVRNGETIGTHVSRFEADRGVLIVSSQMEMKITFLAIPVYSFEYQSRGVWKDGALSQLSISARDGMEKIAIRADPVPGGLGITGPSGRVDVPGTIMPTNHWNAGVINEKQVLNTLTGNINKVTIMGRGPERLPVLGGYIMANRYDYSGDLTDTSVWYDDSGRWAGLQFKARDGSLITYRCASCEPQK